MKCFTVHSRDLFDPKKNPKLSLSAKDILKKKKIKKRPIGQPLKWDARKGEWTGYVE